MEVFDALERVNQAIVEATSSEEMLSAVLDEILAIFDCDRAWLMYPCSLDAEWFEVPIERTRPEFPGVGATREKVPMNDYVKSTYREILAAPIPHAIHLDDPDADYLRETHSRFQIKSQLMLAIHPKGDSPWVLGIHHCRERTEYDSAATTLFQAIGRRVADGLTALLALKQLQQSEQRFRTLVEHAPEAIVILDCTSMLFADANPKAEELFGLSLAQLLSTSPMEMSPELQSDGTPSATGAREYIQAALAGEFPVFQWEHTNSAGDVIPCEVRLAKLPHPSRTLLRGSITNISRRLQAIKERLELEARLAQSQKMEAIGNLTGGIAHDFNNLLTVVFGNLDLLLLDPGNVAFVREQVAQVRAAAEHASALTQRLLAFARRQPLQPTMVDVGRLLRGMDDLLRRTLGETIEIELVLAGGLWVCEVDERQLENAVLNLAINARDAMSSGGRLTIETSNGHLDAEYAKDHEEVRKGQYVLIAVSDSGMGMAPEILDQIFTPFFTTKDVGKGSGLGLSMVYGFVKQSGGHLKAYSEPGVGTTMKIYLPRGTGSESEKAAQTPELDDAMGEGEWVLVVEDEEAVRELTCRLLSKLGYRTHQARTAEEALALLEEEAEIALLLTDVVLAGGINGSELAQLARQQRKDLKILFMSGYSENAIIHNGRLEPNVSLLSKPFTKRSLAIHVREALMGTTRGHGAS